jgi:hypothetical protein
MVCARHRGRRRKVCKARQQAYTSGELLTSVLKDASRDGPRAAAR